MLERFTLGLSERITQATTLAFDSEARRKLDEFQAAAVAYQNFCEGLKNISYADSYALSLALQEADVDGADNVAPFLRNILKIRSGNLSVEEPTDNPNRIAPSFIYETRVLLGALDAVPVNLKMMAIELLPSAAAIRDCMDTSSVHGVAMPEDLIDTLPSPS